MLDALKKLFEGPDAAGSEAAAEERISVAVCALMLEMGKIDGGFTEAELDRVVSIMTEKFGLSGKQINSLVEEADRELKESVDLWQFASTINAHYSNSEKERLLERLWEIVYVDGKMDQHEHYLMNKVSKLLRVSHRTLIETKLRVLHS